MYYLFIKVIDIDYKDEVLLALESADINKASCAKGKNLDNALTGGVPIFKGFFKSEEEKASELLLITALVEEKEQINEFIDLLKESGLAIEDGEIIRVLYWPVEMMVG